MNEVLLLNATGSPVNWLPLSATTWQNAMRLLWLDVVDVLHVYDDWVVHSPSIEVEVPAVLILKRQVKAFRKWIANERYPQAHLIFLRDRFICQYCGQRFLARDLTLDHVIPRRFDGPTTYGNLVSACYSCNNKRGHNVKIRPLTAPWVPTLEQLIRSARTMPLFVPHKSWNLYLKWPDEMVRIVDPQKPVTQPWYDAPETIAGIFDTDLF